MSWSIRIALACCGVLAAGATAWLLSDDDEAAAPATHAERSAPTRTAWGASPFSPAGLGTQGDGFAAAAAPLYARNGRAIDFGGLSAADYIAQWNIRARTGDAAAAYKVYQAADLCAAVADPLADFASDTERADALAERGRMAQLCTGVSQSQIDERMHFLAQAARAGNIDAQVDFFMEGPNGKPQEQAGEDATRQWKAESLAYLTAAGQRGDAFALGLLANAYDAGNIVDPDAKTSLAYTVANAAARKVNLPLDLRSRFAQLADGDFDAAVQRGTQMGAGCCSQ